MKALIALMVVSIVAVSNSSNAQPPILFGVGGESCGSWASGKTSAVDVTAHSQWLWGYISAFNVYQYPDHGDVAYGTDWQGLAAWMDNYCLAHPLDTIQSAALNLIVELRGRALGLAPN